MIRMPNIEFLIHKTIFLHVTHIETEILITYVFLSCYLHIYLKTLSVKVIDTIAWYNGVLIDWVRVKETDGNYTALSLRIGYLAFLNDTFAIRFSKMIDSESFQCYVLTVL